MSPAPRRSSDHDSLFDGTSGRSLDAEARFEVASVELDGVESSEIRALLPTLPINTIMEGTTFSEVKEKQMKKEIVEGITLSEAKENQMKKMFDEESKKSRRSQRKFNDNMLDMIDSMSDNKSFDIERSVGGYVDDETISAITFLDTSSKGYLQDIIESTVVPSAAALDESASYIRRKLKPWKFSWLMAGIGLTGVLTMSGTSTLFGMILENGLGRQMENPSIETVAAIKERAMEEKKELNTSTNSNLQTENFSEYDSRYLEKNIKIEESALEGSEEIEAGKTDPGKTDLGRRLETPSLESVALDSYLEAMELSKEKQKEEGKVHDSTNPEGILSAGEARFLKNVVKDEVSAEKASEQVEQETSS